MPDEPMLVRVINDLADQTPYTKEGRTRLLIEQQLPELTVLQDLEAMHRAPSGESLYNTFHAQNWANKPHRVLYDALAIARKQNAELTAARARIAMMEAIMRNFGKQKLLTEMDAMDLAYADIEAAHEQFIAEAREALEP